MNCFRSLYLWVDLQPEEISIDTSCSCELLSFFVPLGWFTAAKIQLTLDSVLWIAFVLCTFGLIYSPKLSLTLRYQVVNCFRSLYLWVDLQQVVWAEWKDMVVNCFRSLYLWVDLQHLADFQHSRLRCELLSFFVPLGWFTAIVVVYISRSVLWIAFVLCTFGLIYSRTSPIPDSMSVVNCFRSLYLWVDLQLVDELIWGNLSCELLSFFVPLGWFTAHPGHQGLLLRCELLSFFVPLGWFTALSHLAHQSNWLWIAFVLCTFGLIYSYVPRVAAIFSVVNCFRSLYLWVDLQPRP